MFCCLCFVAIFVKKRASLCLEKPFVMCLFLVFVFGVCIDVLRSARVPFSRGIVFLLASSAEDGEQSDEDVDEVEVEVQRTVDGDRVSDCDRFRTATGVIDTGVFGHHANLLHIIGC